MFLLGGDEPYTHFTMETPERPSSPYFTAHLEHVEAATPVALSVCQESRRLALSKGYKAWRIERGDRKVRDLMWNPSMDTVLFVDAYASHCFDLFLEQFPEQVKEVENLALPDSFWLAHNVIKPFTKMKLWQPLMNFTALKRLFVRLDKESWESWVGELRRMDDPSSLFPNNVGRDLYDAAKEEYQENYPELCGPIHVDVPTVSVMWSYDLVPRGEHIELQLK
jgi:hypothetical protein